MNSRVNLHPSLSGDQGVVVVTLFKFQRFRHMLAFWIIHALMKKNVRALAPGFEGASMNLHLMRMEIRSVSLWSSGEDIYQMGNVQMHIWAAHLVAKWGAESTGAVFGYAGDWRTVLFGASYSGDSPLKRRVAPRQG